MKIPTKNRCVLLGVCGGIAAYKACEVVRLLVKAGVDVHVLMTPNATRFVSPLTFAALSGYPVAVEAFPPSASEAGSSSTYDPLAHITLSHQAELLLLAPATANTLAKLAAGIADNLLLSTALAFSGPVVFAPAMNSRMYANPATRDNIAKLKARGCIEVEAEMGALASLESGMGRLAEPARIVQRVLHELRREGSPLEGRRILVTAGGTREYFDDIRFISNASTGTLALCCADELYLAGAEVELIAAPSVAEDELPSRAYPTIRVTSAEEMLTQVRERAIGLDVLLMLAAVADYRPPRRKGKIKKDDAVELDLRLTRTEDILSSLEEGKPNVRIGASLETEEVEQRAAAKLTAKNLSAIVAVELDPEAPPFGQRSLRAGILTPHEWLLPLSRRDKIELSREIAHLITRLLNPKEQ